MIRLRALIVKIQFSEGIIGPLQIGSRTCSTASRVRLRSGRGMWFAASGRRNPRGCGISCSPIATRYWWFGSRSATGHALRCWSRRRSWQALDWDGPAASIGPGSQANSVFWRLRRKRAPAPQVSEARPNRKAEGARKTASAPDLLAIVGSIPKPPVLSPGGARPTSQANAGAAPAMAMRQPLVAAPETRPATIPGWTVVDVRDGTAVLEGPDGIRMAARGDSVAEVGRVESIVRWGSRWVIATAGGLIATP